MVSPGSRLGSYEVVSLLGAGGMGQVYRARDTKLNRDVALKILPDLFAHDAERVARFTREAQTLASLNHPNIAQIYGIVEAPSPGGGADHVHALVMELVEGDDLSVIIARHSGSVVAQGLSPVSQAGAKAPAYSQRASGLPLDDALPIARQIAEALETAHDQGIIHRDLKPANIKVRPDGTVKVLDFGLAKAMDPAGVSSTDAMASPTLTARATSMGMIIGTAAYMAPEQAKGKAVDRRADIWAFGGVLYEMLTGQRAFGGEDVSEVLASVLKTEPDWRPLAADVPPTVQRLLRRCLEKDPKRRLSWIGEARLVLEDPTSARAGDPATSPVIAPASPPGSRWWRALPWALAAAGIGGALLSLLLWAPWRTSTAPAPRKLLASIGADATVPTTYGASAILSPDGSTLVFVAQPLAQVPQLFIRKLDQLQSAPLAGTDNAMSPFFSPDGQWIAFFAGGKLRKVSVTGGASVNLCDAESGRGGTWLEDDTIVFTPSGAQPTRLLRVPASGGAPAVFGTFGEGASTQRWPQVLPGGKAVLYTEHNSGSGFDGANLVVAPLAGGAPKIVVRGAYYGRFVPSGRSGQGRDGSEDGHLLYMQQGTLFAMPFHAGRLEMTGQAVPALEGLSANPGIGGAQLAFSDDGTLVYVPGSAQAGTRQIDWMTRDGKTSVLRAAKSIWSSPKFSPDGQKLAMEVSDGKQRDIWVYEPARDTITQLTFDPANDRHPAWTPDGKRIVFDSDRAKGGVSNLYWVNADGTGEPTRLTDSTNAQQMPSVHPSGAFIAFHESRGGATGLDLMVLPLEGDPIRGWKPGQPAAFLATPATEVTPVFSPDGRWLAYQSNEGGSSDIYVRSFPGPGGKWRVSTEGGSWPAWAATSRELLFLNTNRNRVMVATYAVAGDSFQVDKAQPWSPTGYQSVGGSGFGPYALHPGGKRLALLAADQNAVLIQDKLVFISHFFDYLKKIAPAGKK